VRRHASTASRLPSGGFAGLDPASVLARGRDQVETPPDGEKSSSSSRSALLTRAAPSGVSWADGVLGTHRLLVCGVCGRRLSIQHSKGIYTYFYCLGQKDRRNGTGCQERYVAADQLEAEVEDLYQRIEVPDDWAEGLEAVIAAEVATHHEDTTSERELLAPRRQHAEAERYKLMDAYYANAIDVTVLRREQERIGAELRAIESRQAVLDASLDDWQEVMDLALKFSTRCATAYRRAGDRTRRLFNTAILDEVHVRDGHVVEAAYKEPFDLLFCVPKFEYDDVVGAEGLEPPTPAL
jgi:hypothetical protein